MDQNWNMKLAVQLKAALDIQDAFEPKDILAVIHLTAKGCLKGKAVKMNPSAALEMDFSIFRQCPFL